MTDETMKPKKPNRTLELGDEQLKDAAGGKSGEEQALLQDATSTDLSDKSWSAQTIPMPLNDSLSAIKR